MPGDRPRSGSLLQATQQPRDVIAGLGADLDGTDVHLTQVHLPLDELAHAIAYERSCWLFNSRGSAAGLEGTRQAQRDLFAINVLEKRTYPCAIAAPRSLTMGTDSNPMTRLGEVGSRSGTT